MGTYIENSDFYMKIIHNSDRKAFEESVQQAEDKSDLPYLSSNIEGMIKPDGYMVGILINGDNSEKRQKKAGLHEVKHMILDHPFQDWKSDDEKEEEANSYDK